MKTKLRYFFVLLALLAGVNRVAAQGTTAFTYQGQLRDGGTNANGSYTMIFKLYDAVTNGNQISATITNKPNLFNGLFSVNLDFGASAFNGSARWLDITITNGGTTQTLSPRVQVLPAPYALFSAVAATVTNGAIMNAQLAGNAVNTTNIQNGAITTAQIANGAVTNANLTANAVATTNLQNGAVTDAKISSVSGSKISGVVASAASLASGTWNVSVASVNGFTNVFNVSNPEEGMRLLIVPNNSVMVNGPFSVTGSAGQRFRVDTQGEITFDVGGGNGDPPHAIEIQSPAKSGVPNPGLVRIGNLGVENIYGDVFIVPGVGGVNNGSLYANGNISGANLTASGDLNVSGDINAGLINASDIYVVGTLSASEVDAYVVNAGSFNQTSDQNLKEKFAPINSREVLERVANLPISNWNFKTAEQTRHIGPMAQDFYAAFNVGTDDKHIATVDESGVALAAIQGLNQKLEEQLKLKDDKISALEKRLADLEKLVNPSE